MSTGTDRARATRGFTDRSDSRGRAWAALGLKAELSSMFLHYHGMGDAEPLPGAAPDLFRSEEGVEDAISDRVWDASASVTDRNHGRIPVLACPYPN